MLQRGALRSPFPFVLFLFFRALRLRLEKRRDRFLPFYLTSKPRNTLTVGTVRDKNLSLYAFLREKNQLEQDTAY